MAKKEETINEEITSSVTPDGATHSPQGEGLLDGTMPAENKTEKSVKAARYDPWQDMRHIYIPKMSRTEQNTLVMSVNERTYFLPKEQDIVVPMPLWEVAREMLDARKRMEQEAKAESGNRMYAVG